MTNATGGLAPLGRGGGKDNDDDFVSLRFRGPRGRGFLGEVEVGEADGRFVLDLWKDTLGSEVKILGFTSSSIEMCSMNRLGRGIDELASLCSHCFLTSSAAVEPC